LIIDSDRGSRRSGTTIFSDGYAVNPRHSRSGIATSRVLSRRSKFVGAGPSVRATTRCAECEGRTHAHWAISRGRSSSAVDYHADGSRVGTAISTSDEYRIYTRGGRSGVRSSGVLSSRNKVSWAYPVVSTAARSRQLQGFAYAKWSIGFGVNDGFWFFGYFKIGHCFTAILSRDGHAVCATRRYRNT
jgi:hypothetical protein